MCGQATYNLVSQTSTEITKLYKRRWIVLIIFVSYSTLNMWQWLEYSIISDLTKKYYGVSSLTITWTATLYLALYTPLMLPASYITDKLGLRAATLIGGLGTVIASILKIFAVSPELFWIIIVSQVILASCRTLIVSLPPKIAAVWFGEHEVSTACGIGIFGSHLGAALGFLIPPLIVPNSENLKEIGNGFYILHWIVAGIAIVVGIAIIFISPAHPPLPPSVAQINYTAEEFEFFKSFKGLLKKKGFVKHMLSYGLFVSITGAFGTHLNDYILPSFPTERISGFLGLLGEIFGIFGVPTIGLFLDKTRRFKLGCIGSQIVSICFFTMMILGIQFKIKSLLYVGGSMVGFCIGAYFTAGFEMAVELTHPLSQMTSGAILTAAGMLTGMLSSILSGWVTELFGNIPALLVLFVILVASLVFAVWTPDVKNRQKAFLGGTVDRNEDRKISVCLTSV